MSSFRSSSQARLHVPISDETNQDDDAISQITQADDADVDNSQSPGQLKAKRKNQREEMHRLEAELTELELRAAQLDEEENRLKSNLREETRLRKQIEEIQSDIHRIASEKAAITDRGRTLRDQVDTLDREVMSRRDECEQLEVEIQQAQTGRLKAVCSLHVKSTRDLRIALSRAEQAVQLFDSRLRSPEELQAEIEMFRKETASYGELIERTSDSMDRIESSGGGDNFTLEQQDGKDLLNFLRTVKEAHVKELSALDHAAGRFSTCPELKVPNK